MDDMELFLENWHHPNDTVPIQQRYTHAHYDERRGAAQEIPLHAGNDSIDGGAGADFVLADSDSAAVTNQVEAPSQRDLEVDPEWKVEYLNRMFFELTAHYSRDAAVSDINEDQVIGGDGNDLLFGQWNDDTMQGNAGNDLVYGGSGQNTVSGGAGTNDVRAGSEDTPSKTELDNLKDRVFDAQEPWFNELVRDIAEAPTGTQSGLDLNPITGSLHGTPTISTAVPLGIYELASRIGSEWQVAEMTTEELFATVSGAWSAKASWVDIRVGDVDGDGHDDILGRANGKWWVSHSTGTEFVNENWGSWSTNVTWENVFVGDFNGDGLDDVLGRAVGKWWVARSDGTQLINENWGSWSANVNWQDIRVADVDGDGLDDIVGRAGTTWWVARSTGSSFVNQVWGLKRPPTLGRTSCWLTWTATGRTIW